jgi:alpha-tubulin suppressor-like RCC1 family protein
MKVQSILIRGMECLTLGFLAGCSAGAAPAAGTEIPPPPTSPVVPSSTPTAKPAPEPAVRSIAAGMGFTLALTDAGAVKCWGSGSVCDGGTVNKSVPVDRPGLGGGVRAIAAGGGHACALTEGGGVKCWGLNNFGQLGDDTRANSSAPVDVVGLSSGVAAISAGGSHTCALMETGGVQCWGENGFGQLGDGTLDIRRTPVDVLGLTGGVRAIAAGGTHTCAVLDGGGVKCWGFNGNGQLGNPGTSVSDRYQPVPADVQGLSEPAVEAAAGFAVTCIRTERGGVQCWGQRGNGQLGDGLAPEAQKAFSSLPVDALGLTEGAAAIAVGGGTSCALTAGGAVLCWGTQTGAEDPAARDSSFAPIPVSGLSGVAALAAGDMHVCVLTAAGTVKCWGVNSNGQLGDGTTENRAVPVDVVGLMAGPAA